ncbi:GIY-YIG nuclease family protein [Candidatus Uhrbacteria bacterium]|nr:GIY-YIG nuclease family protein [Candidatus Uhrbacteria bacterium]
MSTFYILFSKKLQKYYIGSTGNLERRITEHNRGQTTWTRTGMPWICVYTESYDDSGEARQRELQIKHWKNPMRIKELIQRNSAG